MTQITGVTVNPGLGQMWPGTNTVEVQGSGFGTSPSLSLAAAGWTFSNIALEPGNTDSDASWQFDAVGPAGADSASERN